MTKKKEQTVAIAPLNRQRATFKIRGVAQLVQHRFSDDVVRQIMDTQEKGDAQRGKKRRDKPGRDYERELNDSTHWAEGKGKVCGHPAKAFRDAMIDACRAIGYKMTVASQAILTVVPDVFSKSGEPLVKINGKPEPLVSSCRNPSTGKGGLIVIRPAFRTWDARVTVEYDGDLFGVDDIANLLQRAGAQVGVGEGRPGSPKSRGCGWGLFEIVN